LIFSLLIKTISSKLNIKASQPREGKNPCEIFIKMVLSSDLEFPEIKNLKKIL